MPYGSLGQSTVLYLKWTTSEDLLYNRGNFAQCYVAAWMRGEFGENGYMYMYGCVPSLFTQIITALLIDQTPIQNKKLKKTPNNRKTKVMPYGLIYCHIELHTCGIPGSQCEGRNKRNYLFLLI